MCFDLIELNFDLNEQFSDKGLSSTHFQGNQLDE